MIVVGRIRSKNFAKMPLAKYNNVVKAVPSDRADEPLTIAILPWRPRRDWPIPNAHCPKASDEDVAVNTVPIASEVPWPLPPFGSWARGYPKPEDFAATMLKNEQPV